ncbi:DUF1583 domain-containing protein [Anatilimnocola floriformis]|uniref:DUF1583 domain-containing protein n=1 Tax=Anatilimnocola floriformis TaxID=2948575 RepID=UPI0020C437AC|nr:DUF1583 domain-containing protein [Anatilimnocola floriformis]
MLSPRFGSQLLFAAASLTFLVASYPHQPVVAQDEAAGEEEFAKQQAVIERYLLVLEKNPRKSTALDKIYGFYVESGQLEALVKRFTDRTTKSEQDHNAWMILGLIEAERGRDAVAVDAFTKAVATSKTALPAFYLGQLLVLVGQPEKAVEALELAIERKPLATDQLEVYRALGRVHQRAQRTKEALQVWERLEKLYPNDARVQEQIAATLVEEAQPALALPRYETLVKLTKDDYRKSVYRMEVADLKVKLNRSKEAVSDLEGLLATLNPTSWLHREVRRKIDDVYLRTDDQDGLAKYYEGWVNTHPEDIDAMARLARLLARQARVPEAKNWLDKALKLAPTRKELRLAFIEQLVEDQRFTEAGQQYEQLDKLDPNNPDYLRNWGKLILRDTSRTKEARLAEAEKIWRRLLVARPKDPLIATQVADLFRHNDLQQPALELYQKAVELAPDQAQYREYLGEFYHQLKKPAEAEATWRPIAEGKNRNATNLARLAEVFASFGYLPQALPPMQEACKLDPKDFSLHVKAALLYVKAEKPDDALAALSIAEKLAQNDEEAEAVLVEQLKIYQLDESLTKRTTDLAAAQKEKPTAKGLFLLARFYETSRQYPEAAREIQAALRLEPQSIRSLAAAARIDEQAGELQSAAEYNRKLAVIDRRGRGEYLKKVSQLEAQLGRTAEALQAGRDLIASAPGNSENYEYYAELCFRLNQQEEGLQTLRRAMRVNPTEPKLLLTLAAALANQFRTDEAVELYWQAFDKSKDIEERINVVQKLCDLYLQQNQFDRLLERLERQRRDAEEKREATICLAQAYHSAGDFGMARQELEGLLSENTRDTQLLQQLSKLAEAERDYASAVRYQEQLAKVAPGAETEYRLATLLADNGTSQESAAIIVRLTRQEEDPEKVLKSIDGLITNSQKATAQLIIETKLREDPKNWELLYREGVCLAENPAEAAKRFEAILALTIPDTTPSVGEKARLAKQAKAAATNPQYLVARASRLDHSSSIRSAIGIMQADYYSSQPQRAWGPSYVWQARMAAVGWLYKFALDARQQPELLKRFEDAASGVSPAPGAAWNWLYASSMAGEFDRVESYDKLVAASRALAKAGDPAGQLLFATSLNQSRRPARSNQPKQPQQPPLSADDLELLLTSFDSLWKTKSAGGALDYQVPYLANGVARELKAAGRAEEGEKLLQQIIATAKTPGEIAMAMSMRIELENSAELLKMFDNWAAQVLQQPKLAPASMHDQSIHAMSQLIGLAGSEKKYDVIVEVLDHYFKYNDARAGKQRQVANRRNTRSPTQSNGYYFIWNGTQQSAINAVFPAASIYTDDACLQVLRNAFEVYKRHDVLSDLEDYLRKRQTAAPEADRVNYSFALIALQAWNNEREAATAELIAASRLIPLDVNVRMQVVRALADTKDYDQALEMLNEMVPSDQDAMREREMLALDIAVRVGDHARAQKAAERMFGLRMDAETQVQLAGQMRRLGMNNEADAVLARAQRQGGNRLAALVALMSSHQANGKGDTASQIAYQILRQSRKSAAAARGALPRGASVDDQYRTAALRVLGSAGKLKQMIADLEQQLSRSPDATHLYDTLAEYYEAAGDQKQSLDLMAKRVQLRQEDYVLRQQYANKLSLAGKLSEACDEYKIVLTKHPRALRDRNYDIASTFRRAKREPELLQLIQNMDFVQIGQPYAIIDLASSLLRADEGPANNAATILLIKKMYVAFPENRQYIMSYFGNGNDKLWMSPELYEVGKQGIIPAPKRIMQDPWASLSQIYSYSPDGEVLASYRRVFDTAASLQKLPELRSEFVAAAKDNPDWKAGPVLIALLDLRAGKIEEARQVIEPLLDLGDEMPATAKWIVGLEIEKQPSLKKLAIKLYEQAMDDPSRQMLMNGFEYSPGPRLVRSYVAEGRRDEALRLMKNSEKDSDDDQYDPSYAAYRRISRLTETAQSYQRLGFEVDALRLYRQAALFNLNAANSPYTSNVEQYRQQAQENMTALLEKLATSSDASFIKELLQPQTARENVPTLDLMIGVQNDQNGIPRLDSQFLNLLTQRKMASELQLALQTTLAELRAKHPGELSVLVATAMIAIRGSDAAQATAALAELQSALEKSPLDELKPGQRPNARQREQAQRQLGIWPVALECLKQKPHENVGKFLATRALAAAERQIERSYPLAILHVRSEQAFAAGDRPGAEKYLADILQIALARPGAAKDKIAPITQSQFSLGIATAHVALERNFPNVAAQAIREMLRGGMPVTDAIQPSAASRRGIMPSPGDSNDDASQIANAVADELTKLSMHWRKKKLPPAEMYSVLHDIVLPADRKGVISVYPRPLNNFAEPESLGCELARWAVASGNSKLLREETVARAESSKIAAQAMQTFLATESGEQAAALAGLEQLKASLTAQPGSVGIQLAANAAAVALKRKELEPAAVAVLTVIGNLPEQQSSPVSASMLLPVLTRHYIRNQQIAELKTLCSTYLDSRQQIYARYGSGGLYEQRSDLTRVVNHIAQAGDARLTLDYLGRFADLPSPTQSYGDAGYDLSLLHLTWQLQALPAAERYVLLKEWTLPTETRRSVRFVAGFSAGLQVPEVFLPTEIAKRGPAPSIGLLSNFSQLVNTAEELGKLDELKQLTEQAIASKLKNAEALATLVAIAGNDASVSERLSKLEAVVRKRVKDLAKNAARNELIEEERGTEMTIVIAALQQPNFRAAGAALGQVVLADNRRAGRPVRVAHLYRWLALDSIAASNPAELAQLQTPGLKHWTVGRPPQFTSNNYPPAWWAAFDQQISHVTGFESDGLYFNYPLTGTFDFTFEAHSYDYSQAEMAFGGLIVNPQYWTRTLIVRPLSQHETVTRPIAADGREWWNRYRIQVTPQEIRFYCNDHLVYVEPDPSPTSPWLQLMAFNQRRTNFRNLKFSGSPEIPAEVSLVSGNRIDGWGTNFGSLPQRIVPREPKPAADGTRSAVRSRSSLSAPQPDWFADEGVLNGRFLPGSGESKQSHLFYYRPLSAGESFKYEFLYEPGKTQVHPVLGRLAFMLEPEGVRLHWVQAMVSVADPIDLESLHSVAAAAEARALPLKLNDWNSLEMKFAGAEVVLILNGQLILQRTLEPVVSRWPGLFYYSGRTAAKARNITLSGWKTELTKTELANLLETEQADAPSFAKKRFVLVREEEFADEVNEVIATAKRLPAEERYSALKAWVLPSPSHPSFRLQVDFTPVDQPWPTLANTAALQGARQHVGGEIVSPALELVRVAAELRKLDELDALVRDADATVPASARNRRSLQIAIAIARGDDNGALAQLNVLQEEQQSLATSVRVTERYAETLAVLAALERPALRAAARGLANQLVESQQDGQTLQSQGLYWERIVRALRARAAWLSEPAQPTKNVAQWIPVSQPTADTRSRGLPPANWSLQKGKAEFFTGHGSDSIYFQSPLSGNFELRLRRTSYGWKEIYPFYGSVGIDVLHDGAGIWRNLSNQSRERTNLPAKIENWGPHIDYRLVVKDGEYTAFFNDKQVHSERILPSADPWLYIQSYAPHYSGTVENVQILGTPTIPEKLELSTGDDLRVWRHNYFGDAGNPDTSWEKKNDEITGAALTASKGANLQSLIRYHRPLLEDGTVEYDFYFEAGAVEVHPAIDRATFLLSPTGVKLHYVTDGPFNRTSLLPDNEVALPGASDQVPLKNKDWNHARLDLVGDTIRLSINDQQVAQYQLEATNQRHFGLFRYSDRTSARVKNVSYRGNWPKEFPAVQNQFLAK